MELAAVRTRDQPATQKDIGQQEYGGAGDSEPVNQFEGVHPFPPQHQFMGFRCGTESYSEAAVRNRYRWADDLYALPEGAIRDSGNGRRTWKEWELRFWLQERNATSGLWPSLSHQRRGQVP